LSLGFGVKCSIEKFDEAGEAKLVHVVHLNQVSKNHEEVAADVSEVSVDLALFV